MSTHTSVSGSEHLYALMYSSDAVGAVDQGTLDEILVQARLKNARLGITGILLFRRGRFFQYLEGTEAAVTRLYDEICQDSRHEHLRVLVQNPVDSRKFTQWNMGYEPLRVSEETLPPGFRSTFDDLEDKDHPENVLRAVTELTHWYRARASRPERTING